MDGANERFKSRKAKWLEDHLIVYTVNKQGARNPFNQNLGSISAELPTFEFDLRKIGDIINNNNPAKAYELRRMDENVVVGTGENLRTRSYSTHAIKAYFLPWGDDVTYCGKLGVNADYFFTPTLNGCTFAHSGGGSNPSVAHSNFVDQALQKVDQTAMNKDLLKVFAGKVPSNKVIKGDYKIASTNPLLDQRAMVVGMRIGNGWKFYYQKYTAEKKATSNEYIGVDLCVEI